MKITSEEAQRRFQAAVAMRSRWDELLTEIRRYAMPGGKDFWLTEDSRGQNRHAHLHDNSLMKILENAANTVIERLMPAGDTWAKIVIGEKYEIGLDENTRDMMNRELQKLTKYLLLKLDRCNFRSKMRRAAQIMLTFGYASVMPRWKNGMDFVVCRPEQFWLETAYDEDGGIFWKRDYTAEQARRMYPNAKIAGSETGRVEICFGNFPLDGIHSQMLVWRQDGAQVLEDYLTRGRPILVGAMVPASGETYPINEGMGAALLPEAQYANQVAKNAKIALAKTVNPPLLGLADLVDPAQLNLSPGKLNPVAEMDSIKPLDLGANIGAAFQAASESRMKMRESMGIMPKAVEKSPFRTATEWLIAKEQSRESGGAWVDAFRDTLLIPVIQQAVLVLQSAEGVIPPEVEVNDKSFRIEISGDLETRRNIGELQKMSALQEMQNVNPVAGTILNYKTLARRTAEVLDLSGMLLTDEESAEVEAQMEARMAQQQGAQ